MRQVWTQDVLFGIDCDGDPYLMDFHLLVSEEPLGLERYVDNGSMPSSICQGIGGLNVGSIYNATLTIFESEDGDITYRFNHIQEMTVVFKDDD